MAAVSEGAPPAGPELRDCELLAAVLLGRGTPRVATRLQGGRRRHRAHVPGHEDLAASGVSELEALRRLRVRLRAAVQAEARRLTRSASEREKLAAEERARAERLVALATGGRA